MSALSWAELDAPVPPPLTPEEQRLAEFSRILAARDVRMVFQPLVDLATGEVVGLEAFARGPEGSELESPAALFDAADAAGRTAELDWVCRAAAFDAALAADIPASMSLFVNVEAASMTVACPPDLVGVIGRAEASLRVFIEVNDHALSADPAGLLATVDRGRSMGWGVSVDDVGASLGCLSVLPMVRPDAVKLEIGLLAGGDGAAVSPVVTSVLRHVEATGAALVVKGIESEADAHLARALGAAYGQGHHLGRPGPLADLYRAPRGVVPLVMPLEAVGTAPLDDLLAQGPVRRLTPEHMSMLSHVFVERAMSAGSRPAVVIGFGHTDANAELDMLLPGLTVLAEKALLVAALGAGVPADPGGGVRGVHVPGHDRLSGKAFLVVMTEHLAVALVARPAVGSPGYFDMVLTQEPLAVVGVARHLLRRIPSAGGDHTVLPPPHDCDELPESPESPEPPETAEPTEQDPADGPHRSTRDRARRGWSRMSRGTQER